MSDPNWPAYVYRLMRETSNSTRMCCLAPYDIPACKSEDPVEFVTELYRFPYEEGAEPCLDDVKIVSFYPFCIPEGYEIEVELRQGKFDFVAMLAPNTAFF